VIAHFFSLKRTRRKALKFANFPAIERVTGQRILSKNYILLALRLLTLVFVIFAISGTVIWYTAVTSDSDFVLAIDSSGSMLAKDYSPNRLVAAKNAAIDFADYLPENSKVGIVSFAGVSFVRQRPTYSMDDVKKAIDNITVELVGGTSIGGAILTSTDLLVNEERSRTVVLLTDGQSNVGVSIEEAVEYANRYHVKVDTIGIGTSEGGVFPNLTFVSKLDEQTLQYIANSTGGDYYTAKNETDLSGIYKKIATASEKKISFNVSLWLLFLALITLFTEWGLINTRYRTIP
jgi:Ca-activated chloride channel family protein